ncbi:hypothetical protein GCK32_020540, partial [Trichostrongylus colubriformis]
KDFPVDDRIGTAFAAICAMGFLRLPVLQL